MESPSEKSGRWFRSVCHESILPARNAATRTLTPWGAQGHKEFAHITPAKKIVTTEYLQVRHTERMDVGSNSGRVQANEAICA
jgi:hypothetical protein